MKYKHFPENLQRLLEEHHRDTVSPEVCSKCTGSCCIQGGIAILENLLLIYDAYKNGRLIRKDYEFPAGLSLPAFVAKYFDVRTLPSNKSSIVTFHSKTLTLNNRLVSWGKTERFNTSDPAFIAKCGNSAGCVFLDSKIAHWPEDDPRAHRKCILHRNENNTCLTEKPVQCVFYTCSHQFDIKLPDSGLAAEWIEALAKCFPNSTQRFNSIMKEEANAWK